MKSGFEICSLRRRQFFVSLQVRSLKPKPEGLRHTLKLEQELLALCDRAEALLCRGVADGAMHGLRKRMTGLVFHLLHSVSYFISCMPMLLSMRYSSRDT